jgi:hypothetical protein
MHGHSVFLQTFQLPALVAAVLINLQQLPPQLLLNLNLHACIVTHSDILGIVVCASFLKYSSTWQKMLAQAWPP